MIRRYLLLVLAFGMMTHLSGCGTGSHADESTDEQFAEEGQSDFSSEGNKDASAENLDAANGEQKPADDLALEGGDQSGGDQQQQADAGAAKGDDLSLDDVPEDVASNEQKPADQAPPPSDDALFKDQAANQPQQVAQPEQPPPPAVEQPPPPVAEVEPPVAEVPPPPAPPVAGSFAPLQKIKDAPFEAKDGTLLNRVYMGRSKDNVKSVAKKIYGSNDRANDLKNWNPILKSRNVKVGDKIYYASPSNPTDQTMKNFYEEQGIAPQVYVTQKGGEDLRKLSKEFLGNKESWKEVWSTNAGIESKGSLPAGTEIKYWPDSMVAGVGAGAGASDGKAPEAMNPPPGGQPTSLPPAPPPLPVEPPPPPQMAANTPPTPDPLAVPPPAPPDLNQPPPGGVGSIDQSQAPLPMEDKPVKSKKIAPPPEGGADDDSIMMAALAGLLLLAGALTFVVIRRNRAKKLDLGQTQI